MKNWTSQRVLIIGAARQGLALARCLASRGAKVKLTDCRAAEKLQSERAALADLPIEWALGGHPLSLLDGIDLLCISGGVPLTIPLVDAAQARGIPLSNDSQIFLEAAPCKVIGITGSAGKTTTTMLVGRMYEAGVGRSEVRKLGVRESPNPQPLTPNSLTSNPQPLTSNFRTPPAPHRVWIGGNIGNPLIVSIDEMSADDIAVMELSSFQLEIMTHSPQVAAVLNVTPNHLDRHLTMEAYTAAKARILDHQTADDVAVLGRDDPGAWELADSVRGGLVSFGVGCPPAGQSGTFLRDEMIAFWDGQSAEDLFPREIVGLRGEHNLLNVLAACAIARAAGLPVEAMRAGVEGFEGVEHRLEFVRSWGRADWYNDSMATAPERAMAAIRSFDEPLVLLAGGRDKDLVWDDFAALVRQRVDHVILFGEARDKVERALGTIPDGSRPFSVSRCAGLQDAVQAAAQIVEPGDVVLLSPGGTSFDEFRDFAERGEWFRVWVNNLP